MIVIDIDGVIADSEKWLIKEIEERSGKQTIHTNPRTFNFNINVNPDEMCLWIDYAIIKYKDVIEPYDYIRTFIGLAMIEKVHGEVTFLTARHRGMVEEATRYWIDKHFSGINYNLCHLESEQSKYEWMNEHGFDSIIEDRLSTANEIIFLHGNTFLVNREWNEGRRSRSHVTRVDSFYDAVENYLKI